MHVTPASFRQPGRCSRRSFTMAAAGWLGTGLPARGLAADHGYRVVASLPPEQGRQLNGDLVQDATGAFYVTAKSGGAHGHGTVTRIGPDGEVTVLVSFMNRRDGGAPGSGLVWAADGCLMGSTRTGGAANMGTLFRMAPDGRLTRLHWFERFEDGAFPSRLLLASDGNYYGTTESGGHTERGTVFRLTPAGKFSTIHHFSGLPEDPAQPVAELVQGHDGLLYGTSLDGGGSGSGTVYRIGLDGGDLAVLHRFSGNGHEGRFPTTALLLATDGHFYGTTKSTGFDIGDTGAAYRLSPSGEFTLLHVFDAELDGAQPDGALVQAADGHFYGTTTTGGPLGGGTVFRLRADGRVRLLHAFNANHRHGDGPRGALLQGGDGLLYGSTGHFAGPGVVFRIRPA